jgi:xanthine dehydrogenase YagS FAD-binding subunit
MKPFVYTAPTSIEEGVATLASVEPGRARPLAGGTDLLPLMKSRIDAPEVLLNVKRMADLPRDIAVDGNGARLGALATLADLELHPDLLRVWPVLSQAAATAASPQLRNMATLGGTLLQRPRCWYYRNPRFQCWLKGGEECTARLGQNEMHAVFETGECRAVHPSDVACALSVLDARVELCGAKGFRKLTISDFFAAPTESRRTLTIIGDDELVVAVHLPAAAQETRSVFLKAMDRAVWAFATVSVAAHMQIVEGRIRTLDVALGGVAAVPWLISEKLEALLGIKPNENAIAAVVRNCLDGATPLRMNAYKLPLARALVHRAVTTLARI